MAKHSRALAVRPIIFAPPRRFGRTRRAARAVGRGARYVTRNRSGARQLPVMGIGVGGLIAGYASGKGWLDKLPQIGGSPTVTLGIVGYVAQRMSKNKYVREAGIAAIAAALFDFGRVQAGKVSGFEGDVSSDAGGGPGGGHGY